MIALLATIAALSFGYLMWSSCRTDVTRAEAARAKAERDRDEWKQIAADFQRVAKSALPPAPVDDVEWQRVKRAVGL